MKNKNMKAASPAHVLILACVALASCQLAIANPENPDDDPTLSAIHAKREPRYQIDLSNVHHDPPGGRFPLPENTLEYPDGTEDHRYCHVFKEIRPRFNNLFQNGRMTAANAGELLEESLHLLHSEYPPYRIHYWMLFVDLACCMTPTNGLSQMRRGEILAVARNLKAVVDDMDRVTIPDYKWYLRSRDSGIPGIGERYYYYNGHIALDPEGIYHFMRMDRIADVHECINSEQWNLPQYRSMIASTIKSMIAIANAKEERP